MSASSAFNNQLVCINTLVVHCLWKDLTVRDRAGHTPSYAEAKKMKSLKTIPMAASSFIQEFVKHVSYILYSPYSQIFHKLPLTCSSAAFNPFAPRNQYVLVFPPMMQWSSGS